MRKCAHILWNTFSCIDDLMHDRRFMRIIKNWFDCDYIGESIFRDVMLYILLAIALIVPNVVTALKLCKCLSISLITVVNANRWDDTWNGLGWRAVSA